MPILRTWKKSIYHGRSVGPVYILWGHSIFIRIAPGIRRILKSEKLANSHGFSFYVLRSCRKGAQQDEINCMFTRWSHKVDWGDVYVILCIWCGYNNVMNHPWLGMVNIPSIYGDLGDGLLLLHPHYSLYHNMTHHVFPTLLRHTFAWGTLTSPVLYLPHVSPVRCHLQPVSGLVVSHHVRLVPLGHIVFPFCISILFVLGFPSFLSFLFSIHDVLQLLQIHVDVCTQYCEARLNSTTVARKPYINLLNQKNLCLGRRLRQ